MKTLPLGLSGLGAKPTSKPTSSSETGDRDERGDFAALLRTPPAEQRSPRSTPAAPSASRAPRQQDHEPRRLDDSSSQSPTTARAADADHAAREPREARAVESDRESGDERDAHCDSDASPRVAGERAQKRPREAGEEADSATDPNTQPVAPTVDAPWPPAGLGGLESALTAAPTAASADGAGPAAQGVVQTMPALLDTATLPATTVDAPASGLPNGASAAATTDLAANIAAPSAIASAAADAIARTGDSVDIAANTAVVSADSASLLAQHAAANQASFPRIDAGTTVFDGTPTPTPQLYEGFDDALGTRLTWLTEQKIGHAHIQIAPDGMGPIEVRLQLDGDKVQASFGSANAEVRHALEQSLPRLREMLGEQGLQLAHANVGGHSSQGRQAHHRDDGETSADGTVHEAIGGVGIPAATLRQRGLLDAYA